MRPASAISFIGLLVMGACLPTNPALPHHAPTNHTTDSLSWDQDLEVALFGLLPGLALHAEDKSLETRGNPPPRDRKVAEQMKSLPECFQTCFRNENGKTSVDIYNWDLNTFCYMPKWILTQTWLTYHIYPCWKWQCRDHMEEIKYAGKRWIDETCP